METPLYGVQCRTKVGNAIQILSVPGWFKTEGAAIEAAIKQFGEHSRDKLTIFTNAKEKK